MRPRPSVVYLAEGTLFATRFAGLNRSFHENTLHTTGVIDVIERDAVDLQFTTSRFPGALTSASVLAKEYVIWQLSTGVMFVLAGAPCRIVATPGKQLGLGDPEARGRSHGPCGGRHRKPLQSAIRNTRESRKSRADIRRQRATGNR